MTRKPTLEETGLPANVAAERMVLGCCLLEDRIGELGDLIPDDFHLDSNRKIYAAMLRMWADKTPIDYLTLGDELQRRGELEAVGSHPYLASLTDGLPQSLQVAHYAEIVRARARERRLLAIAADTQARLIGGASSSEAIAALERGIEQVRARAVRDRAAGPLLLPAHKFIASAPERIDWLVEGVIQRGANGVIAASPRAGKTWLSLDLAIALASASDWLGFRVPRPARVALLSREDPQALTGWRLKHLLAGRGYEPDYEFGQLWCNSRQQSESLALDNPAEMAALTAELQSRAPEMVILDVFNVLHAADENDQTQMRGVLRAVSKLSADLDGAAICIVHHFNKGTGEGTAAMVNRLRGSSAIAGWTQWIVGLSYADERAKIRRAEFELKAGESPDPVNFRIESDGGWSRISVVDFTPEQARPRSATAILGGARWNAN